MGKAKKLKKLTEGLKLIGDKVVKKRMTTKVKKENMEAAKKTVLSPKTQLRNKKSIKPKKKAAGGMLGPHPQQGRPMNIAAPQGPRAKQPLRNMTVPYGKIAKKGPGLKDGGSVKKYKAGGTVSKSKATGAAKRGFGKAYMKGKR